MKKSVKQMMNEVLKKFPNSSWQVQIEHQGKDTYTLVSFGFIDAGEMCPHRINKRREVITGNDFSYGDDEEELWKDLEYYYKGFAVQRCVKALYNKLSKAKDSRRAYEKGE